jgi:hypothetical protein
MAIKVIMGHPRVGPTVIFLYILFSFCGHDDRANKSQSNGVIIIINI